ncbi:MAG: flagellar transcriptional regulator FlhD [Burkholderia gladioli]
MTPTSSELHDEIRELNLSYLMLAQRMLREDREAGMYRLGISIELAEIIEKFAMAQVVKLSASTILLCRFRFRDHAVLAALTEKKGKVAEQTAAMHQAIVLAGQRVEQLN